MQKITRDEKTKTPQKVRGQDTLHLSRKQSQKKEAESAACRYAGQYTGVGLMVSRFRGTAGIDASGRAGTTANTARRLICCDSLARDPRHRSPRLCGSVSGFTR